MIRVEVKGLDKVKAALEALLAQGRSPQFAFDLVGQRMVAMQKRHFIKQEDSGGASWAALKPETIARRRGGRAGTTRKGRLGVAGVGRGVQILRDYGTMYRSMAYAVDATGVEAGVPTTVTYAKPHQFGSPKQNIPKREFCYLTPTEARQLLNLFVREILEPKGARVFNIERASSIFEGGMD